MFSHLNNPRIQIVSIGLFVWSVFWMGPSAYATIWINEILTSTDQEDEYGIPLEWIELFNSGSRSENLLGYTLTDDPLAPAKWMLGAVEIPAGGFIRIWATGYDLLDRGNYHTNFRLDRDGELLALYNPDGTEADAIYYPIQRRNFSFGRSPDGAEAWRYFSEPTPAASNLTAGVIGFAASPSFSIEGGIYSTPQSLILTTDQPHSEIHYTLDGSQPLESSPQFTHPIEIENTVLVRARIFSPEHLPSPIITHSYIFRDRMTLPILSLVAEPDDLFGRNQGIYANPENHGRAWERPVSMEFFTLEGQRAFQENAGIRIHGGASRTRSPKKSFRLYFRSEYGATRLQYPLFPQADVQQFNQIVIRGGFNDTWGYDNSSQRGTAIYVSDQVARDLHRDMGQLASDGIFVELYVNGENWGIYNPSERIEEDFFQQHLGSEGWTVIGDGVEIKDGQPELWDDYLAFVLQTAFDKAGGMEQFATMADMKNFTAFLILNIWIQNYDWPHHNWLSARSNQADGRWLYMIWDMEYAFGSGSQGYRIDINVYDRLTNDLPLGTPFLKLIRNPDYQAYCWQQIDHYLKTSLSEENVTQRLNARLEEIKNAIPWEAQKWGTAKGKDPQRTPQDWEIAAQQARDFIFERTPIFLEQTMRILGSRPVGVEDWAVY